MGVYIEWVIPMKKKITKEGMNEAKLNSPEPQKTVCDRCDNSLMFLMKDNYHEFFIGIVTILDCLKKAEDAREVPELPFDWWAKISRRYGIEYFKR